MKNNNGKVYLIGAGPGDPGLLTLRGAQVLKEADAVVYDGLVHEDLLTWAPNAEKYFAGKVKWMNRTRLKNETLKSQKEIFDIIASLVRKGKKVVRLKGGDPFVFGRGGEEAEFLAKRKINFEIIPGVSAGYAVPAYAGIPVTDRRFASTVLFASGHEDPFKKESEVNWKAASQLGGTLVFFMAVKNIGSVVKKLLSAGSHASTPVCVVENGTLPTQRIVEGTLSSISKKVVQAKIHSPALTIVGKVTGLRKHLNWFEKKPLFGRTLAVLRPISQAAGLVSQLQGLGAETLAFPAIQILPPESWASVDQAIKQMKTFDWVIFTSANGVSYFWQRMKAKNLDSRLFSGLKIAAIGSATLEALEKRGLKPDLCPDVFTSKALFEEFKNKVSLNNKKILLARAEKAPEWMEQSFQDEGAEPFRAVTYRTVADQKSLWLLKKQLKQKKIDWVVLTSASSAEAFLSTIQINERISFKIVSIGPVTSQAIRRFKRKPALEAFPHNDQGIVKALVDAGKKKK